MATFEVTQVVHPLLVGEAGDRVIHSPLPSSLPFLGVAMRSATASSSVGIGIPFEGVSVVLVSSAVPTATELVTIEPFSPTEIDLVFNLPVTVPAFHVSDWQFTDVRVVARGVTQVGPYRARLRIDETKAGDAYRLTVAGGTFSTIEGDVTGTFVGLGGAPTIKSIKRITDSRIRVTFNEPMALNSALKNPGSYRITPASDGASVFVGKVTPERFPTFEGKPTYVDLDITEQTKNKTYNVQARNVTDFAGNAVSTATMSFVGKGDPPAIKNVVAVSKNRVDVVFDKPVRVEARVIDPATYTWDDDALTTVSVLGVDKDRVKLVVTDQEPGKLYTLRIPSEVVAAPDRFIIAGGDTGNTGDNWSFGSSTLTKNTASTLQNWIAKLDTNDNTFAWASKWAETALDQGITGIVIDRDDGSVYVGGYVRQNSGSPVDFFDKNSQSVPVVTFTYSGTLLSSYLTKYDKDGNHVWTRGFHSAHTHPSSGCVPYGVSILPNGDVALSFYDLRVNSGGADARIFMSADGGATSIEVAAPQNQGANVAVCPVVEVDASGNFVRSVLMEITNCGGNADIVAEGASRRADNGLAIAGYGYVQNGVATTFRFGLGEAGEFTPTITPSGGDRSFGVPVKLDPTDLHLDVIGEETVGDNSRDVVAQAAVCDEDGALYSVGYSMASGGADTLTVSSDRWAVPSVTHAFTDTAGRKRPYYAKRNSAGVVQWVKGAGSSSVTTGAVEGVSDCDAVGGKPFIVGNSFTASPKIVLDQGLGTEVTVDAGSAPFPRLWFAKLNKVDGTILYAKKINASANAGVVKSPYSKLSNCGDLYFAVSIPSFDDSASLTLGPGEVNATTLSAIASSRCAAVGVYDAADGSLVKAKRLPDSMGTVGQMNLTALNSSPL